MATRRGYTVRASWKRRPTTMWRFAIFARTRHPDHDTLAEFRKRHLEALAGLFTQALLLCEKAGLVKLGHVSIDGTKIKANAS